MPQNGYYFVKWILNSFYLIVEAMSGVWSFMTKPVGIDMNIGGIPIYWVSEYTMLDMMFFLGIGFYLTYIIAAFFIDILP